MPGTTTLTSRPTPGTCSKVSSSPRVATCGAAMASGTVSTWPAGTPASLSLRSHNAASFFRSALQSGAPQALCDAQDGQTCRKNRGSAINASRPTTRQSASNCSCLLAAIFRSPVRVSNVPDGLDVTLSLPAGCGGTPAMRKFDTANPSSRA